jgi:ParB/RepB/Spo0J family partition protein
MSNALDLGELEAISASASYDVKSSGFIYVCGRKVEKETISVDPNLTVLWQGNPRNFSAVVDISDLVPKIKKASTNVVPVYARWVEVNGVKTLEVIAGSRRRAATIEAGVELTVDVVCIDDDGAVFLSESENDGRRDLDLVGNYRYLLSRFDALKGSQNITVADFAVMYSFDRSHMSQILNIARLPAEVLNCVEDPYTWSHRMLLSVKKRQGSSSDYDAFMEICSQKFKTAGAFVKVLNGGKDGVEDLSFNVGPEVIKIKRKKGGGGSINIPSRVDPSLLDDLVAVVKRAGESE